LLVLIAIYSFISLVFLKYHGICQQWFFKRSSEKALK
jgi:hypothetical protein